MINYKRLTEIDEEIKNIDNLIFKLHGGYAYSGKPLDIKMTFEIMPDNHHSIRGWKEVKYPFQICREYLVEKLKSEKKRLKEEKDKILFDETFNKIRLESRIINNIILVGSLGLIIVFLIEFINKR